MAPNSNVGLGGIWIAWLSNSTTNAMDRVNGDGPFVLTDGSQIAENRADLLDLTLDVPLDVDEYGNPASQSVVVTGTMASGFRYTGTATFCDEWNSSAPNLTPVGLNYSTSSGWSYAGVGDCNHPLLMYCFEQYQDPIFGDDFESGGTGNWTVVGP